MSEEKTEKMIDEAKDAAAESAKDTAVESTAADASDAKSEGGAQKTADNSLSVYYDDKNTDHHSKTDMLGFLLMPLVFFVLLGVPGTYGPFISSYSNFVAQVFFILFGFFTLVPNRIMRRKRLKKSLRRSLKFFVFMFIAIVALNVVYLLSFRYLHGMTFDMIINKYSFFNFFVLNVWPLPIGNSIWFVQSLVYAYVFFLIIEKTRLRKHYKPILIVLIVFMLATGEFAGFVGFPYFNYPYIPGGAFTRAIPYMLIGMYLRKHVDKLTKIPRFVFLLTFLGGLLAAFGEFTLLGYLNKLVYPGHVIGFGIMALSLCCFAISKPKMKKNFFSRHGAVYSRRMYALCQPVAIIAWMGTALIKPEYLMIVREFGFAISFVVSFLIALIISLVRTRRSHKLYGKK